MTFKFVVLALLFSLGSLQTFSQSALKLNREKVTAKELYFSLEGDKLVYFMQKDGPASAEVIDKKQTFSLTRNYTNLFFQWLNPVKYKYTWKDSLYTDEQYTTIANFTKLLFPVFNIPNPADQKSKNTESLAKADAQKTKVIPVVGAPAPVTLTIPKALKDPDLTFLYVQLIMGQEKFLTQSEIVSINALTVEIESLDGDEESFQPQMVENFKALLDISKPEDVTDNSTGKLKKIKTDVTQLNEDLKGTDKTRSGIESMLKIIKIENSLMNSYFTTSLRKYLDKSSALSKQNAELLKKFEPLIKLVEGSVPTSRVKIGSFPNFFQVRDLKFDDGKVMQTVVTVTSYKLNEEKLEMEKDGEPASATLVFKAYDPIQFTVSTGIFYGSTAIKGFGFKNLPNADMVVTEDTIKKNVAVTALFGNINFGIGSRIFAPLIQLGVDPTKRHPFFLLGGGFSIPAAQLAISAGGIWTTQPALQELKPGQVITSSTQIENDIKNTFQLNPKGWYLGIQYNF